MVGTATPSHVIFDMDGTLLDTEELYTRAAQAVVGRFDKVYTWEIKKRSMGGDSRKSAQLTIDALGLPLSVDAYLAERERHLTALLPEIEEIPGASALVEALHVRAVPMALATSTHRDLAQAKLEGCAFARRFAAVVCGDDSRLRRSKPAPDIFLLAAGDLGVAPERCLVFEDSLNGVRAGLAAGMQVVAVLNPRYELDPADFAGAAAIVRDLTEVDLDGLLGPAG